MENMKENLSCDLWFLLPDMEVIISKTAVWNCSEKLMSVKLHVLKIASAVKLYLAFVGILRNNESWSLLFDSRK